MLHDKSTCCFASISSHWMLFALNGERKNPVPLLRISAAISFQRNNTSFKLWGMRINVSNNAQSGKLLEVFFSFVDINNWSKQRVGGMQVTHEIIVCQKWAKTKDRYTLIESYALTNTRNPMAQSYRQTTRKKGSKYRWMPEDAVVFLSWLQNRNRLKHSIPCFNDTGLRGVLRFFVGSPDSSQGEIYSQKKWYGSRASSCIEQHLFGRLKTNKRTSARKKKQQQQEKQQHKKCVARPRRNGGSE